MKQTRRKKERKKERCDKRIKLILRQYEKKNHVIIH